MFKPPVSRLVLLHLNIISNRQCNKYFDSLVLEPCCLLPDRALRRVGPGWRRPRLGKPSLALMEKRQRDALRADDSVAERLAGGVSPSEDLKTDGV